MCGVVREDVVYRGGKANNNRRTIWLWGDNRTTDREWGGDRAKHRWGVVSAMWGQPPCSIKNAVPECGNGDAFLFKGMDHAKVRQAMRAVTKVSLLFLPLLVQLLILFLMLLPP